MVAVDLIDWAIEYEKSGFSVIPISNGTKKPLVPWKQYQERRTTDDEIIACLTKWPEAQIGLIAGSVSGNFVVLDFDSLEAYKKFWGSYAAQLENETPVVVTARGRHVWIRTKSEPPASFKIPGLVDVKGRGGYVVCPPSVHPSGTKYQFVKQELTQLMTIEENFEDWFWQKAGPLGYCRHDYSALDLSEHTDPIRAANRRERRCIAKMLKGVAKGCRNEAAFALALNCKLQGITKEEAIKQIRTWNKRNHPPEDDESKLTATIESAYARNYPITLVCRKAAEIGLDCGSECVFYRPPMFSVDAVEKSRQLGIDPITCIQFAQRVLEPFEAGEYHNRLFMLIVGVSRNVRTTIVRIYGPNAAGKKMLYYWMEHVFGLENVIVISSATAAWLKRKVKEGFSTKGKIFILIEDRGDPNGELRYQFEQIFSEGKIKLGFNTKNEKGEWVPTEIPLEGPLLFVNTSTELEQSKHASSERGKLTLMKAPNRAKESPRGSAGATYYQSKNNKRKRRTGRYCEHSWLTAQPSNEL